MRRPATWWLAWAVALLTALLLAGAVTIIEVGGHSYATQQKGWFARGALLAAFVAFAAVGALVVSRQPRNAVGWIFAAVGLLVGLNVFAGEYANFVYVDHHRRLPAGSFAAWLYLWTWYPVLLLVVLVPMLFPTGRPPGRRWRPALVAIVAFGFVMGGLWMLQPGPMNDPGKPPLPANPIGVELLRGIYGSLDAVGSILLAVFLAIAGAAAVARFRQARDDEKQQLKWMTYGIAIWVVCGPVSLGAGGDFGAIFLALTLSVLPAAAAIAMFRYHLYDIDRVISRTLVYGALTVVLGAAYAGLVLAGQAVFSPFAGGSNLAVAASTLVVAALFLPVRARTQRFVDRRFYRRRYDAQRTLELFAARLRREVDLANLSADLRDVVDETMRPAHVTLWLREGASR